MFACFRIIEAAFVAGEDEASLANGGKSFNLNLKSMHEIREENGTARPIQRKLTSQLQAETESEVKKQKRARHLELTSHLTKELLPVLLEVSYYSSSMRAVLGDVQKGTWYVQHQEVL